jgi:hypothetical protein
MMDKSNFKKSSNPAELGPRLKDWPLSGKVLVTVIIVMISLGLAGAAGQVIVHDIIPTFSKNNGHNMQTVGEAENHIGMRGDLFDDTLAEKKSVPFYKTDKFIFALKFTHIHIFGMGAIFILMGIIVLFLDLGGQVRIWLIVLPFIGVIVDLSAVWLKLFVHPGFFWLHIPGGLLFATVFSVDAVLMLGQMWSDPYAKHIT